MAPALAGLVAARDRGQSTVTQAPSRPNSQGPMRVEISVAATPPCVFAEQVGAPDLATKRIYRIVTCC